ncbi:MAG: hypothetical protein J2P24_00435 [Streptosporangiales bacterium]|nr:hypothetical protein [Streptosporangiales bacterium]
MTDRIEFLRARLAEEDAEHAAQGDTLIGQLGQLSVAVRNLGFVILLELRRLRLSRWWADVVLKGMVARYADHPDYHEESWP